MNREEASVGAFLSLRSGYMRPLKAFPVDRIGIPPARSSRSRMTGGWGMSDKVVSLRGRFKAAPAQPNTSLVRELERLLEAARAGEIVGMAGSYVHRDKVVSYSYAGVVGGYAAIGGL